MPLSLGPQIRIGAEMVIIGAPPFPRLDLVCTPLVLSMVVTIPTFGPRVRMEYGRPLVLRWDLSFFLQPHIPSLSTLAQDGSNRSGVSRTRSSYRLLAPCGGVDTESIASHYPLSRAWELGPWNFLSGV